MKSLLKKTLLGAMLVATPLVQAADYVIDTKGAHAFIQFKIQHLGYSWLYGRFNQFGGNFSYDPANPKSNAITVEIDMASVDTNHAERDKHIRSEDFLNTDKFPKATFVSTAYQDNGNGKAGRWARACAFDVAPNPAPRVVFD